MIITFYSYKGGTGRTMALANVAALLARRGHRVLAVDFDLEAPGLWRYFSEFHDQLDQQPGLIDLLVAAASTPDRDADWRDYLTPLSAELGQLTLMTSGRLVEDYSSRVLGFGWTEFFQHARGGKFLEQLRQQWRDEYDFTLIDSRTGITDTGGICTIMLPDMIIPVFVSNRQSIDGAVEVIARAQAGRKRLAYDRPPAVILPVFSRFEGRAEYQTAQHWLDIAAERVQPFYSDWLPSGFNPRRALERTKLPYVTYFSFGEQLPALTDSTSDPESLGYALNVISLLIEQRLENAEVILGGAAQEAGEQGAQVTRAAEPTAAGTAPEAAIRRAPGGESARLGKITATLRIGVYGHRSVSPAHPGLTAELSRALEYITQRLAATPGTPLTVVSCLAEGADRVVAHEVLKASGARLEAVLPVPAGDYLADFSSPPAQADFTWLLAQDPNYDVVRTARTREHAYELAGRAVVDRSDVMLIIWDGEPARGPGGTAEILAYAQRWRRPVVLIRVTGNSASLDVDRLPYSAEGTLPLSAENMGRLDRYNGEPVPANAMRSSPFLLDQVHTRPWLAAALPMVEHINRYFTRADLLALRYQRRFFQANRLQFILAPLAVLIIVAQVVFAPSLPGFAWAGFGVLAALTVLYAVIRRAGWRTRWTSARYLAEQLRSQVFLGLTGILTVVNAATAGGAPRGDEAGWTERAANEVWLTRPRFVPPADHSRLVEVLHEEWIRDQQKYYLAVSRRYRRLSGSFPSASVLLFAVSSVAALLHSLDVGGIATGPFRLWDFLAIILPAVAGAFSGYGAQRDYGRRAERARLFAASLDRALDSLLNAPNLDGVQQAALAISQSMLDEVAGWPAAARAPDAELPS
jgi:cellulose biosynthesis protein BcsQ